MPMESYTLFCCYWQFGISIFHASNNNDEISNYNDFDISRSVLDDLVVNFDVLTNEFQAPVGELTNDRQVNTEPEVDDHETSNTDSRLSTNDFYAPFDENNNYKIGDVNDV